MSPLVWALLGSTLVVITVMVERVPRLRSRPDAPTLRPHDGVAVVIPARNEADQLPLLLEDLALQSVVPVEIVVVDDESDDDTARLALLGGARVIAITSSTHARPSGWNPKVWALTVGADDTTAPHLVFLDADVRLAPGALAELLRLHQDHGGLASVAPRHVPESFVETFSAACNVIVAVGGGPGFGHHAQGAVGSCVSIARRTYEQIGGHRARPATIVDDLELAASARTHAVPVVLARGADVVTMRSYPQGGRTVVEGWTKNFAAGLGHSTPLASIAVALWIAGLVLPIALLAQGAWRDAALVWATTGIHLAVMANRVGSFPWMSTAALAPLHGLFVTAVTVASVAKRFWGSTVTWKGRALDPSGLEHEQP